MSVRVTERQLQDKLTDLLNRADTGEECIVRRRGRDSVVLVSAEEWNERRLGKRIDALGSEHRLAKEKQTRLETLTAKNSNNRLTASERREFDALLGEGDEIMLRRASALKRLA